MTNFDVIIIGGGAIGAFSLFHLAKRGVKKALLLEQAFASGRGATGSWGSLLRATHKSPITTQKATMALPFYQNFFEHTGAHCHFSKSGSLYFFKISQLHDMKPQLDLLNNARISYRIINAESGRKEFPNFNWFDDDMAIFEDNAGTACPHATTEALIAYATKSGAHAHFSEAVVDIKPQGTHAFAITSNRGVTYHCANLIIAAGRWSKELANLMGIKLDTYDKIIQINRFCRHHFRAKIPLFIDRNLATFGHFFPDGSFAGGYLLQNYENSERREQDRLSLRDASIAKLHISKRLNWLKNSSLEGGIRAVESYSPSGQGTIMRIPELPHLILSAGYSCTGFTLAPHASEAIVRSLLD